MLEMIRVEVKESMVQVKLEMSRRMSSVQVGNE